MKMARTNPSHSYSLGVLGLTCLAQPHRASTYRASPYKPSGNLTSLFSFPSLRTR
jgi:hypothetical protein